MGNRFKELARAKRLEIQILGKLTLEKGAAPEDSYLCNTINISTSGALVETGSEIPVGSLLMYSVILPGIGKGFDITGEVVRGERGRPSSSLIRQTDGGSARKLIRYGIMFLDLRDDDRKAMEDFFRLRASAERQAGPGMTARD